MAGSSPSPQRSRSGLTIFDDSAEDLHSLLAVLALLDAIHTVEEPVLRLDTDLPGRLRQLLQWLPKGFAVLCFRFCLMREFLRCLHHGPPLKDLEDVNLRPSLFGPLDPVAGLTLAHLPPLCHLSGHPQSDRAGLPRLARDK